jgi:hypothetical protein
MGRHRRVLGVWTGTAVCTALAWVVAQRWPDQWPAAVAVLTFLIVTLAALAFTMAGTPPSQS